MSKILVPLTKFKASSSTGHEYLIITFAQICTKIHLTLNFYFRGVDNFLGLGGGANKAKIKELQFGSRGRV